MRDVWQSAKSYEAYIGRWSRPVAREFVTGVQIAPESTWIDVGCGAGAVTSAILAIANPACVVALDRSFEFVEQSRRTVADDGVVLAAGDAVSLPLADHSADVADDAPGASVLEELTSPVSRAASSVGLDDSWA